MIIDSKIIFDFLLSRLFIEHRAVLSLSLRVVGVVILIGKVFF